MEIPKMMPRELQPRNGNPFLRQAPKKTSGQPGGDLSDQVVSMSVHSEQRRDRDQQILDRLANIEHKVDSFDQTQAFALRADAKKHLDEVKKIFGDRRRRAQVYLATDGSRSVTE